MQLGLLQFTDVPEDDEEGIRPYTGTALCVLELLEANTGGKLMIDPFEALVVLVDEFVDCRDQVGCLGGRKVAHHVLHVHRQLAVLGLHGHLGVLLRAVGLLRAVLLLLAFDLFLGFGLCLEEFALHLESWEL